MMTETKDLTVGRFNATRVGGLSAILYVVVVVAAVGLFSSTGLLEATSAADAFPIWGENPTVTAIAGWLFVAAAVALAVAGLGASTAVRGAGSLVTLGLLAILGGSLLALIRNVFWLAIGTELAPAFVGSTGDAREALVAVGETLLGLGTILGDQVGGVLIAGVAVPIFSVALLRARSGSRWLARLGFLVAITAPFTLLTPLSEFFELISLFGFVAFLVWMVAVGWMLWRPRTDTRAGSSV